MKGTITMRPAGCWYSTDDLPSPETALELEISEDTAPYPAPYQTGITVRLYLSRAMLEDLRATLVEGIEWVEKSAVEEGGHDAD